MEKTRKIVVLDGYTANPGDLSWEKLERIGDVTIYDRTKPHHAPYRMGHARSPHPPAPHSHRKRLLLR